MRQPLIGWLDAACRSWGYAVARGRLALPEYAGRPLVGDALLVEVAIQRATDAGALSARTRQAIRLHYDGQNRGEPVKRKCGALGVSVSGYYYHLAQAHRVIDAYWPTDLIWECSTDTRYKRRFIDSL